MEEHPATTASGVPLWCIGVIINIIGSVSINFATNAIKLSHNWEKESKLRELEALQRAATPASGGAAGSSIELSSSGASLVLRGSQSREPLTSGTVSSGGGLGRSPMLRLDPSSSGDEEEDGVGLRAPHYLEGHIIDGGHEEEDVSTCTSRLDEYQQWIGGLVGRGLRLFNLSPRAASRRVLPSGVSDDDLASTPAGAAATHRWNGGGGGSMWRRRRPLSSYLTLGDRPVQAFVREKVRHR